MCAARMLGACLLATGLVQVAGDIAVCPGEGSRYQDHKCNHDPTHRVCAQLLDTSGQPQNWGKGNFWEITGQTDFQWDAEIRANNGNSWCICMWATASLIQAAGCDNVHLDCAATDVSYVMRQYTDGGTDLAPAKACLQQKCGAGVTMQKDDATVPKLDNGIRTGNPTLLACAAFALVGFGVIAHRRAAGGAEQINTEETVVE